jgi:flagellin-like hook-associated protein FlgL
LARKGAEASVLTVLKQQRSYIRNNLESAVSKIRDTDVAAEMSSMIRHKILVDSGAAMLKKATDSMKVILTLLNSSNIK